LESASYVDVTGLCKCEWTSKNYNAGGYFDRHSYTWGIIPITEGRQNCVYRCAGDSGVSEIVTHVQKEWYFGHLSGGPGNAKKFICPMQVADWIAHYDLGGFGVLYYEPVLLGSFNPIGSGVLELENWAKKNCSCDK
jgi:hypothetical protein